MIEKVVQDFSPPPLKFDFFRANGLGLDHQKDGGLKARLIC
jgi:hypothetical protein